MNDYVLHLVISCSIYLILAQAYNVSFGLGRLLNLAHIGAYAIGAYTTALLSVDFEWSFIPCLATSVVFASFLAYPIGVIAGRLTEEFFVIGSLTFHYIILAVLINWRDLTRGVLGIPGIPRPELFGFEFSNNSGFSILAVVSAAAVLVLVRLLFNTKFARVLRAQSENAPAARALGFNIARYKNLAFIISSALAGLAGSIFAYYLNYIDPSSFNVNEMVFVLSIVIIGRPGSFWGVCAATIFLVLLPEPLRFIELPSSLIGPLRQLMFAALLYLVLFKNRARLFPKVRNV